MFILRGQTCGSLSKNQFFLLLISNLKHVKKTFPEGFVRNQLNFLTAGPKGSRGRLIKTRKKNFSFFTAHYARKKREKRNFFCKMRYFVNFPKFTKSLRQYLGNLITNNEVFSFFVSEDRCVLDLAHRLSLPF